MLEETLSILVDPVTKEPLKISIEEKVQKEVIKGILSNDAGTKYLIQNSIANLIPKDEDMKIKFDLYNVWQELQKNGLLLYEKFPELNLSIKERKDVKSFQNFCSFYGNVLDIGCGPKIPAYLENNKIEFAVGIDPLLSFKPKSNEKIELIQAIGELLPFEKGVFDMVCFATSFDHVMLPELVLNETKRVVKKGGFVIFWIEEDPNKKLSLRTRAARKARNTLFSKFLKKSVQYENDVREQNSIVEILRTPSGAADKFHINHIQYNTLNEICESKGFKKKSIRQSSNKKSVFVKYQI